LTLQRIHIKHSTAPYIFCLAVAHKVTALHAINSQNLAMAFSKLLHSHFSANSLYLYKTQGMSAAVVSQFPDCTVHISTPTPRPDAWHILLCFLPCRPHAQHILLRSLPCPPHARHILLCSLPCLPTLPATGTKWRETGKLQDIGAMEVKWGR
jgi:hypothetical protein